MPDQQHLRLRISCWSTRLRSICKDQQQAALFYQQGQKKFQLVSALVCDAAGLTANERQWGSETTNGFHQQLRKNCPAYSTPLKIKLFSSGMEITRGEFNKERFAAFIDAILAIVITILILEFKVPRIENATDEELKKSIGEMMPAVLCYVASFLTLISLWIDHHQLFRYVTKVNKPYVIINFFFLLTISPLPFCTAFAGEYITHPFAVALFASNVLLMNTSFSFVFLYPIKKGHLHADFKAINKSGGMYATIGMVLLVAAVPLVYLNTYLAFSLIFAVMLSHLLKKI